MKQATYKLVDGGLNQLVGIRGEDDGLFFKIVVTEYGIGIVGIGNSVPVAYPGANAVFLTGIEDAEKHAGNFGALIGDVHKDFDNGEIYYLEQNGFLKKTSDL